MKNDTRPKPALERHALAVYSYMFEHAHTSASESGINAYIWTGKITAIFQALNISMAHYSSIRSVLVETGSVEIIVRGSRGIPSTVALHHPPPPEISWPEHLTESLAAARLSVQAKEAETERRLRAVEGWRDSIGGGKLNIAEALRNMEMRLTTLEAQIAALTVHTTPPSFLGESREGKED